MGVPDSPDDRRPPARRLPPRRAARLARGAGAVSAGVIALAGCSQMNAALSKQSATVMFKPGTSAAAVLRVRLACSHVPNVKPPALKSQVSALDLASGLVFDVSSASLANEAQLQLCLQKYPAVVQSLNFNDISNGG